MAKPEAETIPMRMPLPVEACSIISCIRCSELIASSCDALSCAFGVARDCREDAKVVDLTMTDENVIS